MAISFVQVCGSIIVAFVIICYMVVTIDWLWNHQDIAAHK